MESIPVFHLTHSEEASKSTYKVETNLWDYKLCFCCPVCGLNWQTKEYSFLSKDRPDSAFIHCGRDGGCGNRYWIYFDRPNT